MPASDQVIADSIKLRDGLQECAKEFRIRGQMATRDSAKRMAEYDAQICEAAALMMEKLGTEVTRLRLSIQHFGHRMHTGMTLSELNESAEGWNNPEIKVKVPDIREI